MSKFSEKRLAEELAGIVHDGSPMRRRRDLAGGAVSLLVGFGTNFIFNKIEIAGVCWLVTLVFITDLIFSFGKLAGLRGFPRWTVEVIIVSCAMLLSLPFLYSQYRSQHASLTSGVLQARSDGKDHSKEAPKFQVGDSTIMNWAGDQQGPFIKAATDRVKLRRDSKGKLLFSTTVRDSEGKLVVEIVDNHWRVATEKTNCWDKNYTDDSLEVKDGRGRVVLQVHIFPDRAQFQVEWPTKDTAVVWNDKYSKEDGIVPRFLYPSEEHWRELDPESGYATTSAYSSDQAESVFAKCRLPHPSGDLVHNPDRADRRADQSVLYSRNTEFKVRPVRRSLASAEDHSTINNERSAIRGIGAACAAPLMGFVSGHAFRRATESELRVRLQALHERLKPT